mmetsp:Transcript_23551/g.55907  ORF Transcript_23551/g.55907 Transcript_23551/m.55907 type:complete len:513 (+) Transcript_23551:74-1612(+)
MGHAASAEVPQTNQQQSSSSRSGWQVPRIFTCGAAPQDLVPYTPAEQWKRSLGKNQVHISKSRGGLVGLVNMGNTCFMNAGLQCLSHIEPISAYFLTGKYAEELNPNNPFGTGGHLAKGFAKLQEMLWQKRSRTHSPSQLYGTLSKFARHLFRDSDQQDAQELLAYLLDGLHEDLNLVQVERKDHRKKESEPKVDSDEEDERMAQLEREKGEEYVAALTWMKHLMRHKSVLVDLFQGQLRSRLTCNTCGHQSKTFDPYLYIALPVHYGMNSLQDALMHFLKEEHLTGDERWRCPKCKKRVDSVKKIDLWKLPPVLLVHLKRFEFDTSTCRFKKINVRLRTPLSIDLSSYVSSQQKGSLVYDVIAVANHIGHAGRGHYTAICRHHLHNRFYHFNDTDVHEVRADDNEVITREAYLLFLMRRDISDWEAQSISRPEAWPHYVSRQNSAMMPAIWEAVGRKPQQPAPQAPAPAVVLPEQPNEEPGPPGEPDLSDRHGSKSGLYNVGSYFACQNLA